MTDNSSHPDAARSGRPALWRRHSGWLIFLLFLILLKIPELTNLSAVIHPDDINANYHGMKMLQNYLDPDFFVYNHLVFYFGLAANLLVAIPALASGAVSGADDFYFLFLTRPDVFFLANRVLFALVLFALVYSTYRLILTASGSRLNALLATVFVSTNIGIYAHSYVTKPNLPGLLALVLLCLMLLRYDRENRSRYLLLAAFFAATAFSAKITYGISFVILGTWLLFHREIAPGRRLLVLAGAGLFSFLLNPWLFIRFRDWLHNLKTLSNQVSQTTELPPFHALGDLVLHYMPQTWSVLPCLVLGLLALYWIGDCLRDRRRPVLWFVLPALFIWSLYFGTRNYSSYRYFLPLMAFLPLLVFADIRLPVTGRRGRVWLVASAITMTTLTVHLTGFSMVLSAPTTNALAGRWIKEHIPAGAILTVDGQDVSTRDHFRCPNPAPDAESLAASGLPPASKKRQVFQQKIDQGILKPVYRLHSFQDVHHQPARAEQSIRDSDFVILCNSTAWMHSHPNSSFAWHGEQKGEIRRQTKALDEFLHREGFELIRTFQSDVPFISPVAYIFPEYYRLTGVQQVGPDVKIFRNPRSVHMPGDVH